jgi:hypothetical protein
MARKRLEHGHQTINQVYQCMLARRIERTGQRELPPGQITLAEELDGEIEGIIKNDKS